MRTVAQIIKEAVQILTLRGNPLTATYIMWMTMNIVEDDELHELGSDIVDAAEKVELYLTGVSR